MKIKYKKYNEVFKSRRTYHILYYPPVFHPFTIPGGTEAHSGCDHAIGYCAMDTLSHSRQTSMNF